MVVEGGHRWRRNATWKWDKKRSQRSPSKDYARWCEGLMNGNECIALDQDRIGVRSLEIYGYFSWFKLYTGVYPNAILSMSCQHDYRFPRSPHIKSLYSQISSQRQSSCLMPIYASFTKHPPRFQHPELGDLMHHMSHGFPLWITDDFDLRTLNPNLVISGGGAILLLEKRWRCGDHQGFAPGSKYIYI